MEKVTPPKSANKAAFDVVLFQKKPMVNNAKIPGDTYPVYSWINSKPPFLSMPIKGAITTAATIDATTAIRPIRTKVSSFAVGFKYFL